MAHLRCFYSHSHSDWLRLGPFKIEVNSYDPFHAVIRNLMFDNECDAIKDYLQSSDRLQALDCRESGVERGFEISSAGNNDASSDEWSGSSGDTGNT